MRGLLVGRHFGLPNPDAYDEQLDRHWREPPPTSSGWWSMLAIFVAVVLAGIAVYSCSAQAHMHDRPDLDKWFDGLKGAGGALCCSWVDGSTVADPDWDTITVDGKSHYRVRIGGEWIVVADTQVVEEPNRYGQALVWVYHVDGKPVIRCFMPGTQT